MEELIVIQALKCEMCKNTYSTMEELEHHRKSHIKERPFKCEECDRTFNLKHHLVRHRTVHTGQKPFKCDQCGNSYNDMTNLRLHLAKHSGEKPYKCNDCSKGFWRKYLLDEHVKIHEVKVKEEVVDFDEIVPTVKLQKLDALENVVLEKSEVINGHKCLKCNRTFKNETGLRFHNMRKHEDRPFKCDVCEKAFAFKPVLEYHKKQHVNHVERCEKCGNFFKSLLDLQLHYASHEDNAPFKCSVCNKTFPFKASLLSHLHTHVPKMPQVEEEKKPEPIKIEVKKEEQSPEPIIQDYPMADNLIFKESTLEIVQVKTEDIVEIEEQSYELMSAFKMEPPDVFYDQNNFEIEPTLNIEGDEFYQENNFALISSIKIEGDEFYHSFPSNGYSDPIPEQVSIKLELENF